MSRRPELVGRRRCWYEWDMVIGVRDLVERSQGRERAVIAIYTIDRYWILPFLTNNFTKIPRRLEHPKVIPSCLNQVSTLPRLALLPSPPRNEVEPLLARAPCLPPAPRLHPARPSSAEKVLRARLTLVASLPTVWRRKAKYFSLSLLRSTSKRCG